MPEEAILDADTDVEDTDLEEIEDKEIEDEEDHVFVVKDDDEEDEPDKDEKKEALEDEVDLKDLREQIETQATEVSTLKSDLEKVTKEKNAIAYQLRTANKETKKTDEDPEFTDAQLQGLLEEHKDDPAAMLQIMRLVAGQTAKTVKKDAVDEIQVSNTKKEMDEFLTKTYPDLADEGSDFRINVNKTKSYLGMDDHPYGDFLSVGTMVLNQLEGIIKHAREEGKNEALKNKAEDKRKKTIKSSSLSAITGKKKMGAAVSSRYLNTAKQMGLSKTATKRYLEAMAKKSTVDGEG